MINGMRVAPNLPNRELIEYAIERIEVEYDYREKGVII